jgi:hypothetical protein
MRSVPPKKIFFNVNINAHKWRIKENAARSSVRTSKCSSVHKQELTNSGINQEEG